MKQTPTEAVGNLIGGAAIIALPVFLGLIIWMYIRKQGSK